MTEEKILMVFAADDSSSSKPPTSPVILKTDASNYIAWKRVTEFLLRAQSYAWDVTSGSLKPDGNKANFDKGNQTATTILICSIDPNVTAVAFDGVDLGTINASNIWTGIKTYCEKRSGAAAGLAFTKFMTFKFDESKSGEENINDFNLIIATIEQSKTNSVTSEMRTARLLSSLPNDWQAYKQSMSSVMAGVDITFSTLAAGIIAEDIRRKSEAKMHQTTAFFSHMNIGTGKPQKKFSRRPPFRRPPPQAHYWMSQETRKEEKFCSYCRRPGHTINECYSKAKRGAPKKKSQAHIVE